MYLFVCLLVCLFACITIITPRVQQAVSASTADEDDDDAVNSECDGVDDGHAAATRGGGGEAMVVDNDNAVTTRPRKTYTKKSTASAALAAVTDTSMITATDDQLVHPPLTAPALLPGGVGVRARTTDGTAVSGGLPIRKPLSTTATQKVKGLAAVVPRTGTHRPILTCTADLLHTIRYRLLSPS